MANFWNEFIALWQQEGYLASQILVIFGLTCMAITYQTKNKGLLLIFASLASVFYGTHYFLLGSIAGAAVNGISIVRNIAIYFYQKKGKEVNTPFILAFIIIFVVLGIITMNTKYDIISIVASVVYTLMLYKVDIKVYRWTAILHSALWIAYSVLLKTVFGTVSEVTLLIIEIVGIIRLYSGNKKNIKKA